MWTHSPRSHQLFFFSFFISDKLQNPDLIFHRYCLQLAFAYTSFTKMKTPIPFFTNPRSWLMLAHAHESWHSVAQSHASCSLARCSRRSLLATPSRLSRLDASLSLESCPSRSSLFLAVSSQVLTLASLSCSGFDRSQSQWHLIKVTIQILSFSAVHRTHYIG